MNTNFINSNPQEPIAEYKRGIKMPLIGKKANSFTTLVVAAALIFSLTGLQVHAVSGNIYIGGSIVVIDDDDLEVDCDGEATIYVVKIYQENSLVLSVEGCYENLCKYDISSLSAGNYHVFVYTTQGSFSDWVTVPE